jgi:hypothetical protein
MDKLKKLVWSAKGEPDSVFKKQRFHLKAALAGHGKHTLSKELTSLNWRVIVVMLEQWAATTLTGKEANLGLYIAISTHTQLCDEGWGTEVHTYSYALLV